MPTLTAARRPAFFSAATPPAPSAPKAGDIMRKALAAKLGLPEDTNPDVLMGAFMGRMSAGKFANERAYTPPASTSTAREATNWKGQPLQTIGDMQVDPGRLAELTEQIISERKITYDLAQREALQELINRGEAGPTGMQRGTARTYAQEERPVALSYNRQPVRGAAFAKAARDLADRENIPIDVAQRRVLAENPGSY